MKTLVFHSDSLDIGNFLKNTNKRLDINDKVKLEIKMKQTSTLYYGYFSYYGFIIDEIKKLSNKITVQIIKKQDINSTIKDKKYSLLIKLPRTGKNGKRIFVYKLRTMQPYSEYLQDYIIKKNGLNDDGTIRDDFRITKIGKFLRKYWLDELPMLINWLKGDLKLIGVRPLSDTMLNTYPQEYVKERNQYKPGLIPPYYVDRPNSFDGIIESEKRYIEKYKKSAFKADMIYFYKFLKAVFFRGVRSS